VNRDTGRQPGLTRRRHDVADLRAPDAAGAQRLLRQKQENVTGIATSDAAHLLQNRSLLTRSLCFRYFIVKCASRRDVTA
jgi:hypothetical protein